MIKGDQVLKEESVLRMLMFNQRFIPTKSFLYTDVQISHFFIRIKLFHT